VQKRGESRKKIEQKVKLECELAEVKHALDVDEKVNGLTKDIERKTEQLAASSRRR